MVTDETWRDDGGGPPAGHNAPPPYDETFLADLKSRVIEFAEVAREWNGVTRIEDGTQAAAAAEFIGDAGALAKEVDETRKDQKRPHTAAAKAVDEAFGGLKAGLDLALSVVKRLQTDWLKAEEARLHAEQQAEAERAQLQLDTARRRMEDADARADFEGVYDAEKAVKEAERAVKAAGRRTTRASAQGAGKRKVTLRTTKRAQLKSVTRAALHFKDNLKFREFLESLASEQARKGATEVPGFTIVEEKSAA